MGTQKDKSAGFRTWGIACRKTDNAFSKRNVSKLRWEEREISGVDPVEGIGMGGALTGMG